MTFAKQKTTTSTSNHPSSNRCRQFTNNTAAMLRRVWVLTVVVTFWYTISTRLSQSFLLQVAPPSDPRWIQQRRGQPATGVAVTVPPLCSWRTIASCQQQQRNQPTVCMVSAESEEKEPEVVVQIEDLSLLQLAELMEVTFIQACMVRLLLFDDVFFVPMPKKSALVVYPICVCICISTTAS
jgi:hypothetical protein